MKKFITIAILLFSLNLRPAHGAVALLTTPFNSALAGQIATVGLSGPIVGPVVAWVFSKSKGCGDAACAVGFVLGTLLGLVLLEDGATPQYSHLTLEDALKLGVSEEDLNVYNSEVSQANILLEEVSSQINENTTFEDVKNSWAELDYLVSPQTLKVMKTISSNTKAN